MPPNDVSRCKVRSMCASVMKEQSSLDQIFSQMCNR